MPAKPEQPDTRPGAAPEKYTRGKPNMHISRKYNKIYPGVFLPWDKPVKNPKNTSGKNYYRTKKNFFDQSLNGNMLLTIFWCKIAGRMFYILSVIQIYLARQAGIEKWLVWESLNPESLFQTTSTSRAEFILDRLYFFHILRRKKLAKLREALHHQNQG